MAYGTVWQSIDRNNGKHVAIKRVSEAFRNLRDAKVSSLCKNIACSNSSEILAHVSRNILLKNSRRTQKYNKVLTSHSIFMSIL